MRRRSTRSGWFDAAVVAVSAGVLATALAGCFSLKQPPCAFSCADPPHSCPASYTCLDDGLCHLAGATAACELTPPGDAGTDAGDGATAN